MPLHNFNHLKTHGKISLLAFVFLSACNLLPTRQAPPADVLDASIDSQINSGNAESSVIQTLPLMNSASHSLYNQAQQFYQNNQFTQAIASLERAFEIQPNAPQISQLIAEISLHQGNFKQAQYWAGIATKNGPSKGSICEKSWRILAIAAGKTGYYAQQTKALAQIENCQVKIPNRF